MTAPASDPFAYWELSMLLHADHGPKVFCPAHLEGPAGWNIANCTREADHTPPHVDCHEGTRWT